MPVRLKPIIPSRLGLMDPGVAERIVTESGHEAAETARDDLKEFTRGWRHRVEFKIEKRGLLWSVYTTDPIFFYQDEGTDPYTIRPKRKRALYWSGAAHPVRVVRHPGLKPQDFSGQVEREMRREFKVILERRLRAAQ